MAYFLLVSLLLQSCYNSSMPPSEVGGLVEQEKDPIMVLANLEASSLEGDTLSQLEFEQGTIPMEEEMPGTALSNDFPINQVTGLTQSDPSLTSLASGNAFEPWQGDQTGNQDIYGRLFAPSGTDLSNEFTIN
jgi:hypothetical protein